MIWRLVVVLLILTVIRHILVRFFNPAQEKPRVRRPPEQRLSGRMVKDPQCGMYVSAELALTGKTRDGVHYFCSPECRDQYAKARLEEAKS